MDIDERIRLRADLAALRFQLALVRLGLIERKYSPDQPRVPAGSLEGGRWTDEGADGVAPLDDALAGAPPPLDDGLFRPDEDDPA